MHLLKKSLMENFIFCAVSCKLQKMFKSETVYSAWHFTAIIVKLFTHVNLYLSINFINAIINKSMVIPHIVAGYRQIIHSLGITISGEYCQFNWFTRRKQNSVSLVLNFRTNRGLFRTCQIYMEWFCRISERLNVWQGPQ